MGAQFGNWNFNSTDADPKWLAKIDSLLVGDRTERSTVFSSRGLTLVCCDVQMIACEFGNAGHGSTLFWDGRLDNRQDLVCELGQRLSSQSSNEAEIACAAFERWQMDAFRRLLGDWRLVLWNPAESSLILAKDPIGTRPLFYNLSPHGLKWSSTLELLARDADSTLVLNQEYLAGWLSFFPAVGLTPYASIHAVPPSCFVRFASGRKTIHKYWDFAPEKQIQYRTDAEYEEHFRILLTNSVRRRLQPPGPALAELSGGMDSTSIVCIADGLLADGELGTQQLDTISYYDDSEPSWNERPYFTKVEEKRGRPGVHLEVDAGQDLDAIFHIAKFAATPAACGDSSLRNQKIKALVKSCGYIAILSGTGGDEFTGGVPTARPELADLLAAGRIRAFWRELTAWAISQRRPWIHLLYDAVSGFAPPLWTSGRTGRSPATWLMPQFVHRYREALNGYDRRIILSGPRPSFQENLSTLDAIRRQLACLQAGSPSAFEKRYPYLDRDLLEFLFAIPRRQLIQPGRRRALMRRALAGIVPEEILNRKRKAYVARAPRAAIALHWDAVVALTKDMIAESMQIVSSGILRQALEDARTGNEVSIPGILRTLVLEQWLRNVADHGVLSVATSSQQDSGLNRAAASLALSPRPEGQPKFS